MNTNTDAAGSVGTIESDPSSSPAPEAAPAVEPTLPPVPPAAIEEPTPEQLARTRAHASQQAIDGLIKEREDKAAAEIQAVCKKYGVDMIVGHSVKVVFNRGAKLPD